MFQDLSWKLKEHSELIEYGYKHNLLYDICLREYRERAFKNWLEFPLKHALAQGFKFSQNTPPGALREIFCESIYDVRGFTPGRGQWVVDVGANYGDTAIWWAKTFGSKVFAFEPLVDVYNELNENVKLNGVDVITYNVALGNGKEIKGNSSGNMFSIGGSTKIKTIKLDDYLFERLNLLKIDVEGFEYEVLQGAKKTISRYRPKIIIETHSKNLRKVCHEFLSSLGYFLQVSHS